MRRPLLPSVSYERDLRRHLRKHPRDAERIADVLQRLEADSFEPSLKSHKLRGSLDGRWACSGGYDVRVLFKFVALNGEEAILLLTIGTHDDVY